jgi:hypothetical protein
VRQPREWLGPDELVHRWQLTQLHT